MAKKRNPSSADQNYDRDEEIRINKFIAHSGLCSRRDADKLIEEGRVKVNGKVVKELGMKVKRSDKVEADGQNLSLEPFTYLLLNKSKDVITTTDDERDRRTVMDQIEDATGNRVYPVGRLDRNTTGLLILTNDGDLAHRLMHPSYKIRKTYEVETERTLTDAELNSYASGITLEDGPVKAFNVERSPANPKVFMLSVYEGRNRLIRRMAEHYGTEVSRLKRIEYAGLNLKNVGPGRWRYLRKNEVNGLRKLVKLDTLDFNK